MPKISSKFKAITESTFVRSVLVLVGGAAVAHGITALALPILTRLYTPADFSLLAVFSGVLAVISVAACLRFDIAVAIPERDDHAVNLLALAVLCAAVVSTVVLAFVLAAPQWIAERLNQPQLAKYLWMLPIGIFLAGTYNALQNWFIRKNAFGLISRSRVAQSAASASVQVGLGTLAIAPLGLLFGHMMNTGAACLGLGFRFFCELQHHDTHLSASWRNMKIMLIAYQRFPKFSTCEALFNSAAIQVPIILIAGLSAGPEAGYLVLAMSVMQAPMSLFGNAIGQVYLSRAPAEYRAGRLGDFTAEVLSGLLKSGVGPLFAGAILAPQVFGLIFGAAWERAGWLVTWMTPWFIFQFLASPLSMVYHITGRQKAALLTQLGGFILRTSAVLLFAVWKPEALTEAYAVSGFIFYFCYFLILLNIARVERVRILRALQNTMSASALWIVGALLLSITIKSVSS